MNEQPGNKKAKTLDHAHLGLATSGCSSARKAKPAVMHAAVLER